MNVFFLFFFFFLQVAATSFAIFVFTGNVLTASKAFVALSLFNVMRFPLVMLPDVIVTCIRVSTCSSYVYVHLHSHTEPGLGWGWLEDKGILELITVQDGNDPEKRMLITKYTHEKTIHNIYRFLIAFINVFVFVCISLLYCICLLLKVRIYQECHSLIGSATHDLFCCS